MDYEQKYKDLVKAVKELQEANPSDEGIQNRENENVSELVESEDERIRKALIKGFNECLVSSSHYPKNAIKYWHGIVIDDILAWLEKQCQVKESTEIQHENKTCKKNDDSLTSEDEMIRKMLIEFFGKGAEHNSSTNGISDKDILDWLEKQKPVNENEFAKGVLIRIAMSIMQWLDANLAEGNMCLSNMECEDLEIAVRNADWQKVYGYMKKKLEKQGVQKPTDTYCKENCKGYQETGKCYADGDCDAKIKAEQKPNWSKEDEELLKCSTFNLREIEQRFGADYGKVGKCIDWLQSLKERAVWKPSEEQLYWLKYAADSTSDTEKGNEAEVVLNELYEQLKKL